MARIYLETTIISFYHNVRTEPEMVARQTGLAVGLTLNWWGRMNSCQVLPFRLNSKPVSEAKGDAGIAWEIPATRP